MITEKFRLFTFNEGFRLGTFSLERLVGFLAYFKKNTINLKEYIQ